jgi:hypothetical protein
VVWNNEYFQLKKRALIVNSRKYKSFLVYLALAVFAVPAHAISWQSVLSFIQTMQSEMSAWAVTTKQTSVAAHQVSQANLNTQKALATAIGAISMSERVSDAVMSVDGQWGQPVTIKCTAQKAAAMQVEAWSQVGLDRSKLMGTFASTRVASKSHADRERLALRKDSYCTVGEARSGMCELKANGMQGWDSNYGGPFGERTLAAEGELAGYAYAAMVADVRAAGALDCKSKACEAAASQQLALAAVGTMAADAFVGQVLERRVPVLTGK